MKNFLKVSVTAAVLSGTAFFLLADSARKCPHDAESVKYAVAGTCGAAGTITVHSDKDSCTVTVDNSAAVGLPPTGEYGSKQIKDRDFRLYGEVSVQPANDGGAADAGESDAGSTQTTDGGLEIVTRNCSFTEEDGGTSADLQCTDQASCTATLTEQP